MRTTPGSSSSTTSVRDSDSDSDTDSAWLFLYSRAQSCHPRPPPARTVFMEFNRDAEGRVAPLEKKNIDTGMGLERMAQILQRVPNNYETDLVRPLMDEAARLAGTDYDAADDRQRLALKVIADHTRAVTYLVSDGVTPSNVGRGYVVRRLLRRVVMKGRLLGIPHPFLPAVSRVSISLSGDCDPDVARNADRVLAELEREEMAFVVSNGTPTMTWLYLAPLVLSHHLRPGEQG